MELKHDRQQKTTDTDTADSDDPEFSKWAKNLLTRQVPQAYNFGQNSGMDKASLIPPNSGFDYESAIGKFTWHTIGKDKDIPCLFRNGSKYCCIRMVEGSVTHELQKLLPQEIYDFVNLHCQPITALEAKLLSYINKWHCESFYGNEDFSEKDIILPVQELEEFYSYLTFANKVLSNKGLNKENDFSKCGFVRVSNSYLIPYTVLKNEINSEKGVPLFYFEGKTDMLKNKIKILTGWELAYLKICCRLQGVKKNFMAGHSLQIVKLSDIRSNLPKDSTFTEQCWLTSKEIRYPLKPQK